MSTAFRRKPRLIGRKSGICVVASRYNEKFTDPLVDNTIEELGELAPTARIDLIRVPGAFEIPVTVSNLLERQKFDCVIALGIIIRGDTQHADLVAGSVTDSLQQLSISSKTPIIHEILLVDNEEQANARTIGKVMNRGKEAARAAASMIDIFAAIEKTMQKLKKKF